MNSALYVRRFSLNLIRDLIGNQYSDFSRGLSDSESLLDLLGQGNSVQIFETCFLNEKARSEATSRFRMESI